ncbi:MAG: roadblock/LC7 domain-containing protein [Theionarchaea archaeon]|nr:roadblock/LC7 domain-containing protein [Theionarchaea archaeon]
MTKKPKINALIDLLEGLESTTPDIEASAVVSSDGFMVASLLQGAEEDRAATMSAAILLLGERAAKELQRGELSEVYVKGENGYVLLTATGENAVLATVARKDANLTSVFHDMKRTAAEMTKVINGGHKPLDHFWSWEYECDDYDGLWI